METASNITKIKHELSSYRGSAKKLKFVFREATASGVNISNENSANCEVETSSESSHDEERDGLTTSSLEIPIFEDDDYERGNRKRERKLVASQAIDNLYSGERKFSPLNKNSARRS